MSQNSSVNFLSPEEQASISLPPSVFHLYPNTTLNFTLLFTMFNSSVLLPWSKVTDPKISVASNVIGTTLLDHEVMDLDDNITITLRLEYPVSVSFSKWIDIQYSSVTVFFPMTSEHNIFLCITYAFLSPFIYRIRKTLSVLYGTKQQQVSSALKVKVQEMYVHVLLWKDWNFRVKGIVE